MGYVGSSKPFPRQAGGGGKAGSQGFTIQALNPSYSPNATAEPADHGPYSPGRGTLLVMSGRAFTLTSLINME